MLHRPHMALGLVQAVTLGVVLLLVAVAVFVDYVRTRASWRASFRARRTFK